jgi:hypothetical protein
MTSTDKVDSELAELAQKSKSGHEKTQQLLSELREKLRLLLLLLKRPKFYDLT